MGEPLRFDYYYGVEAEQFSFYRVPRLLIKDERFKGLSSDAKLLYGLMLDRMSLSMKNGWLDDENRAYIIYTIDNIREDLGCSKEKAVKVLAELDKAKGIGLVEKIRRGLGKPDIIYVKTAECEGAVLHPTQKPVELGRYMIRTYTNPGDVVLDNTFGSGSFLVAALMEGRNFIGIEKNENVALFKKEEIDYIDVAKRRLFLAWEGLDKKTKKHIQVQNLIAEFEER